MELPLIWTADTCPDDDTGIDAREFEKTAILHGIETAITKMEE